MNAQHLADFGALVFAAFSPGEAFEARRRVGVGFGKDSAGNFGPKTAEEIHQNFEVVVHVYLDAGQPKFCRKSAKTFLPALAKEFSVHGKIFCKTRICRRLKV